MRRLTAVIASVLLLFGVAPAEAKTHPVATRAEFHRLKVDMTKAQVAAVFGEKSHRQVEHYPLGIYILPSGVRAGEEQTKNYYTGRANQYAYEPGKPCYAIEVTYIRDAAGVYRLVDSHDYANTCPTKENRG